MATQKDQRRTYHLDRGMFHLPTGKEAEPPLPVGGVGACRISPAPDANAVEFTDEAVLRAVVLEHFTAVFRVPDLAGETERLVRYTMHREEESGEPDAAYAERRASEWREKRRAAWAGGFLGPGAELGPAFEPPTKEQREHIRRRDEVGQIAAARRAMWSEAELARHDAELARQIAERIAAGDVRRVPLRSGFAAA